MKIIGGQYKGRLFKMPKGIRPTQDVLRKALFDILNAVIRGSRFLDLFAGSGAVGLEALSREASEVVFVEKEARCVGVIQENLRSLRGGRQGAKTPRQTTGVLALDAFSAIRFFQRKGEKFDIIFLDPPYLKGFRHGKGAFGSAVKGSALWLAKKTLQTLVAYDILSPNGLLICQHSRQEGLPQAIGDLVLFRQKRTGGSVFSFYRKA